MCGLEIGLDCQYKVLGQLVAIWSKVYIRILYQGQGPNRY